jgi:hypothetical protein
VTTTIIGARRSRKEQKEKSDEQCVERLRSSRAEAEDLAQALHRLRMAEYHPHPDEMEKVDDILDRWSHLE